MDLWVIAAATGAGYIAKILRNSTADQKESLGVQCSYDVQSEPYNSLQQFRDRAESFGQVNHSEINDGLSTKDVELSEDDALLGVNDSEIRDFSRSVTIGNPTRYKRAHLLSTRPFFSSVTSRSRLDVNKLQEQRNYTVYDHVWLNTNDASARFELCNNKERWKNDVGLRDVGTMLGFESVEEPREKASFDDRYDSISGHEAMLLFVTGVTMGILFAAKTRKSKTVHAKEKLVFEDLTIENKTKDDGSPKEEEKTEERVEISDNDVLMSDVNKTENAELMSRIEGELRFELELLEQSINASSNAEIDSDLEIEVVRGDLRMAKEIANEPEKEKTHTFNNPQPPPNYAVSPWELTLRLHELIESRLRARIEELETALHDNTDQVLNSQDVIIRKMGSSSHHLLPHNQFMGARTFSGSVTFGSSYPQVNEIYNGFVGTVKGKNQENESDGLSTKALQQQKPFIRPKI